MTTTTLNDSPAPAERTSLSFRLLELNVLPDWLIRLGIRRLLAQRLNEERRATEEQALRSKGEKYREYQRRTSMFVPLPRR